MTDHGFTYAVPAIDPPQNYTAPVDNRLRLEVDPKQLEAWELAVMESPRVSDWMLVFSRYLARNGNYVSPGLPSTPINEMTTAEREQIMASDAYKAISRFKLDQLRAVAKSFADYVVSGF